MILFEDVLVVGGVLVFFVEKNARADRRRSDVFFKSL